MKKNKIIYWTATGIIGLMMLLSAYNYFTNEDVKSGFIHLGFPDYFRVELGLAKVIGAIVLLIPIIPGRIKEWAYAGFTIVFISASLSHLQSSDASSMVMAPIVFLAILIVSYIYFRKTHLNTMKD